jgi:uncharacterized protein (TIGR03790 family)
VTVYGVPLKISQFSPSARDRTFSQSLRKRYQETFSLLMNKVNALEKMAGVVDNSSSSTQQPTTYPVESFKEQLPKIVQKIESFYRIVIPEIQAMKDPVDRDRQANEFGQIRMTLEGQGAFVQALKSQSPANGLRLEEQLKEQEKEFFAMHQVPPQERDLDKTYSLARSLGGLFLELKTIYEDIGLLGEKDSAAAVDSELSLVLWDSYPHAGRLPNPLNPRLASHPAVAGRKDPVMMVSRLDGPNADSVKRMIRDSIATETKGLTGKCYIDARGITTQNGFSVYDQDLRNLADNIRKYTQFPVVLDDKPELFLPAACPDTALYCGWYSLKKYIPSCAFVPGSVGYHIASFEATTLKHPKNTEWVQNMIENGITATLGAIDEPYLDSFPLPSEFFGLLLTGNYTLVELFYKTNRYLSWRIILIGDPFYRPFAANPQMKESEVSLKPMAVLLLN